MGSKKDDELQRYQVLFGRLEEECIKHKHRVPNIMEQIKLHEHYLLFLQCADKVVGYKNGILFPFGKISQEDRIVIYGAGRFGCELKRLLETRYGFKIVAWIDKVARAGVQTAECLNDILYDKIIIAVLVADIAGEIRKELENKRVREDNILSVNLEWMKSKSWRVSNPVDQYMF